MYTISAIFLSDSTLEIMVYLVLKYYCCWLYFPKSATKVFPSYILFLQWCSFRRQARFMVSPFKLPGLKTAEWCYAISEVRSENVTYECMLSHFSHVQFFAILWTVACQALLSMGILQERILEWVVMTSSRGSSWPSGQSCLLCLLHCRWIIHRWAMREAPLLANCFLNFEILITISRDWFLLLQ